MPNPQTLAEAIRNLKELEQELLARLGNDPDDKRPGMDSAVGRLSFMDAFQQHQMDKNAQRRATSQLTAVRAALKRVPDGTYGVCMKCGCDIAVERLEYVPETTTCTRCTE